MTEQNYIFCKTIEGDLKVLETGATQQQVLDLVDHQPTAIKAVSRLIPHTIVKPPVLALIRGGRYYDKD